MKKQLQLLTLLLLLFAPLQAFADDDNWWESDVYVRKNLVLLTPNYDSVWRKYSNNGTLRVSVFDGDRKLESYECAVYDAKGELRECKSSLIDQGSGLGLCMLTIHGDFPEEMHFRVVYEDESGETRISSVRETLQFYTGSMDAMELHIDDNPSALASFADGTTYEFTSATCASYIQNFPSTTSIIFTGDWTTDALQAIKTLTVDKSSEEMNPNCLYFFPAHVTVPEGWNHAVQSRKMLTDVTLVDGQYPFLNPMDIDLDGHRATYTRAWALADGYSGWNTIVVPFDAKAKAMRPDGSVTELLSFDSFTPLPHEWSRGDGMWICRVKYANSREGIVGSTSEMLMQKLEANSPYLITFPGEYFKYTSNGTSYSLDMTDCYIYLESMNSALPKTPAKIVGSWQQTEKDDYTYQGNYQVLRGKEMWLLRSRVMSNGTDAFVKYTAGNLLPFRGYLSIPSSDKNPQGAKLRMALLEDLATSVPHVCNSSLAGESDESLYNINGIALPSQGSRMGQVVIRKSQSGHTTKKTVIR